MSLENSVENKLEEDKEMVEFEVASTPDSKLVEELAEVEKASFKGYEEGSLLKKEDFIEYVEDSRNVVLIARRGKLIVGYAIVTPLEEAIEDLSRYDPEISESDTENKYYCESIAVIHELRKQNLAVEMTREIIEELKKRGAKKYSLHISSSRGRHDVRTKDFLKNSKIIRTIPNWLNSGKSFDYIEYEI